MTDTRILEIRTYRLYPGARAAFDALCHEHTIPMLRRYGVDVVGFGPSIVDEDGHEEYVLLRAFDSIEQREEQEKAFYSSEEWHLNWRDAILSKIETWHTVVLEVSAGAIAALR